jgi:transcriptional regulator with XRE-family HTH domain
LGLIRSITLISWSNCGVRAARYHDPVSTSRTVFRIGSIVRDIRRAIGWSQRELASRAGVSQSLVSAIENGHLPTVTVATTTRLLEAMGAKLIIDAVPPFIGDRQRQRDPAHARCTVYVARRLEHDGWKVATEVEIGGDRSRGWIDLLAYHPESGVLIVVEIKTEIHDIGGIERSLGWYEREAWNAGRWLGWRPRRVLGSLILLATVANDDRLRLNRETFAQGFSIRSRALSALVANGTVPSPRGRGMVMIDPASRRREWLRPTWLDGRRTQAPYVDYVDFMRTHNPDRNPRR